MDKTDYILTRKVRELANLITKNRNADIRELGLTASQADAILYFAENSGKSAADLKDFLGITHQTARGIIQRMADKGFLKTSPSTCDARYKQIFLTEKGLNVYQSMQENGTRTGRQLMKGMSAEEKEKFLFLLNLGLNNLNETKF